MKLNQLRSLCEIVDNEMNISRAAAAMHTSQPGISKQIRLLEEELGTPLLKRKIRQVVGLTDVGKNILSVARRVLLETARMRELARATDIRLTVATTPTQARYIVLPALMEFVKKYPKTELSIRQASPTNCAQLVASGEVDIALATEPVTEVRHVHYRPCGSTTFGVITPSRHALARLPQIQLADLACFPLIIYDPSFRSGRQIRERFRSAGLVPNIPINVNAVELDLIKAYVKAGFGVGVLPIVSYHSQRGIRMIPVGHLFSASTRYIMTLQGRHIEPYQGDFIEHILRVSRVLTASSNLRTQISLQ